MDLKHVSLDGSKVRANAYKHKAMSYGRMHTEMEHLEREIREMSAQAQKIDSEEDVLYGKGKDAHEIPGNCRTGPMRYGLLGPVVVILSVRCNTSQRRRPS